MRALIVTVLVALTGCNATTMQQVGVALTAAGGVAAVSLGGVEGWRVAQQPEQQKQYTPLIIGVTVPAALMLVGAALTGAGYGLTRR